MENNGNERTKQINNEKKNKHSLRAEYFLMELILSDWTKCAEEKETRMVDGARARETNADRALVRSDRIEQPAKWCEKS